jgi:hypothetical protein
VCSSSAQTIQNCQCNIPQGNVTQVCTCTSTKSGFTFPGMTTVDSKGCFCLNGDSNTRACNCCVSEDQFKQVRPQCPLGRDASACKCDSVNGTLQCNCSNQYFFNQSSIVSYRTQNCACYGSANQTTSLDCQCCSTQLELNPAPVCAITEQFVNCQ